MENQSLFDAAVMAPFALPRTKATHPRKHASVKYGIFSLTLTLKFYP